MAPPVRKAGRPPARRAYTCGLCLLIACAGGGTPAPPRTDSGSQPEAEGVLEDFAPQLIQLLPRGADRCVVARPVRLEPEQRALFAPVSQAEPLAWLPTVRVLAYASVEREARTGPGARVTYLRVEGARDEVRRALEKHGGVSVRWGDFDCGAEGCRRVRAAFVGEGILRIERGRYRDGSRAGAERSCGQLAEARPDALEIATMRARSLPSSGLALPLRGRSITLANARGVRVMREELMGSREAAALALEEQGRGGALLSPLHVEGLAPRLQVEGDVVRREVALLWEDLSLRADDRERLRQADARADALERMSPAGDVDLRDREAVIAQVGYRLDAARGAAAEDVRAEVRAMLEGALTHAPEDEGLALMLAELLMARDQDAHAAQPLVDRFVGQPGRDARWRLYRRHLAALSGARELIAALLADELVPRALARTAARDILARLPDAPSYAAAEQQVLGALEHERRERRPRGGRSR